MIRHSSSVWVNVVILCEWVISHLWVLSWLLPAGNKKLNGTQRIFCIEVNPTEGDMGQQHSISKRSSVNVTKSVLYGVQDPDYWEKIWASFAKGDFCFFTFPSPKSPLSPSSLLSFSTFRIPSKCSFIMGFQSATFSPYYYHQLLTTNSLLQNGKSFIYLFLLFSPLFSSYFSKLTATDCPCESTY